MSVEPKAFATQMKNFFGYKQDQKLPDFMAELKALDDKDKADFTEMLNEAGYPVLKK